ncbi:MAG TPA: hypothetical protein VHX38_29790 [Pseudonocardiaceae bacterium]|nr:hypothetical protein [Pseudonocardiaceae bacterium]
MTTATQPQATPRHTETSGRLNQPWRAALAIGEVLLAAVAVVVGVWCWRRGIVSIVTPTGNGTPPLVSIVFYGNWMSSAIGLCTVAALLVLDALRQTVLAVRTRRRSKAIWPSVTAPLVDDPSLDEKPDQDEKPDHDEQLDHDEQSDHDEKPDHDDESDRDDESAERDETKDPETKGLETEGNGSEHTGSAQATD